MSARTAPHPARTRGLDVERLADALARVTRSTRRELALPIGASSLSVLATVTDRGPLRLGDLARVEGITPATLSRIVAVLEDDGLAERTADPVDRRSSWLMVTPAGLALLAAVRRDRAQVMVARVDRLSAAQRTALSAALDALEALSAD
ncbi:MAG: MarR family transcriptional regulator [Actinomycetales bacterium]|nr:MarR family transcriptional regulator [Actinomycetales bacterium]